VLELGELLELGDDDSLLELEEELDGDSAL
jgi:hypothetical protein